MGFFCLLPGSLQPIKGAYFCIETDWICATPGRRQAVGSEIIGGRLLRGRSLGVCFITFYTKKCVDRLINYTWINDWTVGSDAYDHLSVESAGSLIVAIKYILTAAAITGITTFAAKSFDCVISRSNRRSDNHFIQGSRLAGAFDDAHQHWLTSDIEQHFIRQTR